ncbi:MAG TPA: hypothetical protein VIG06_15230 [Kofleriaceae bacterium]|jgi:hypothetical protein
MRFTGSAQLAPLLVACLAGAAAAQPAALTDGDPPEKSPALAFSLSLLGTGAGVAALVAASHVDRGEYVGAAGLAVLVVGPSLGHIYAGEPDRGVRHAAVRLGAVATMVTGLAVVFSSPCAFGSEQECPETREEIGLGIFVAGALLGAGSAIYSIVDAPLAARRTNRRSTSSATLLPAPIIGPDRSTGFGLLLGGSL